MIIIRACWVKAKRDIHKPLKRNVWEWITGGSGDICSIAQLPESLPSLCSKTSPSLSVHTHTPTHLPITQGWAQDQVRPVAGPHPSCHCDQFRIPLDLYESFLIFELVGTASLFPLVKTEYGYGARTAGCHDSSRREQGAFKGQDR